MELYRSLTLEPRDFEITESTNILDDCLLYRVWFSQSGLAKVVTPALHKFLRDFRFQYVENRSWTVRYQPSVQVKKQIIAAFLAHLTVKLWDVPGLYCGPHYGTRSADSPVGWYQALFPTELPAVCQIVPARLYKGEKGFCEFILVTEDHDFHPLYYWARHQNFGSRLYTNFIAVYPESDWLKSKSGRLVDNFCMPESIVTLRKICA